MNTDKFKSIMWGATPYSCEILDCIDTLKNLTFNSLPAEKKRGGISELCHDIIYICDDAISACAINPRNLTASETAAMKAYIEDNDLQAYELEVLSTCQYNFAHVKKLFADRVAKIEKEGGEK